MRTLLGMLVVLGVALAGCGGRGDARTGEGAQPAEGTELAGPTAAPAEGQGLLLGDPMDLLAAEAAEGQEVALIPLPEPPSPGLWWWHDGEFTALARVAIVKRAQGAARAYCLDEDPPPPTELPAGALEFLDSGSFERKLLRLDGDRCAGVPGPPPDSVIRLDADLGEQIMPGTEGRLLRRVTLQPGEYVYADWATRWFREEASFFVVR